MNVCMEFTTFVCARERMVKPSAAAACNRTRLCFISVPELSQRPPKHSPNDVAAPYASP